MEIKKLNEEFYTRSDVVELSKQLLGKHLCTNINNEYTEGKIVETEAYKAPKDRGSHAYGNKRTRRTEVFFNKGGIAYIYLIYGMYRLFNVITNLEGIPHAILIRAVEPIKGLEIMKRRRKINIVKRNLTAGPGLLSEAMGIEIKHNGTDLLGNTIWIEDRKEEIQAHKIIASSRVGMNFEGKYKTIPWRFRIKDNPWTNPAR